MKTRTGASTPRSAGITLTEILISILILGVGLVSLATLFPIGLLRLREAQRQTRSAYLFESATADTAARGLLNSNSFVYADLLNPLVPWPYWYVATSGRYNPLTQDTALLRRRPARPRPTPPPVLGQVTRFRFCRAATACRSRTTRSGGARRSILLPATKVSISTRPSSRARRSPLRRRGSTPSGLRAMASRPAPRLAAADQLQPPGVMPSANWVPNIFVSPEDMVWQESTNRNYTVAFSATAAQPGGIPVGTPSTVVPDLSITYNYTTTPPTPTYQTISDWRFSWMLTAQQTNGSNGASFDGNIVVFENRQFAYDPDHVTRPPARRLSRPSSAPARASPSRRTGRHTTTRRADRTVLIRWPAVLNPNIPNSPQSDPVVKVGDWIADVTYERVQNQVTPAFTSTPRPRPCPCRACPTR